LLTDGKPDLKKIKPFIYGMGALPEYFAFREFIGRDFLSGKNWE